MTLGRLLPLTVVFAAIGLARIDPRGVQDRAALPVDTAHILAVERDQRALVAEQSLPAPADTGHPPSSVRRRKGDRANARVEPWDVAAACQNSNMHAFSLGPDLPGDHPKWRATS